MFAVSVGEKGALADKVLGWSIAPCTCEPRLNCGNVGSAAAAGTGIGAARLAGAPEGTIGCGGAESPLPIAPVTCVPSVKLPADLAAGFGGAIGIPGAVAGFGGGGKTREGEATAVRPVTGSSAAAGAETEAPAICCAPPLACQSLASAALKRFWPVMRPSTYVAATCSPPARTVMKTPWRCPCRYWPCTTLPSG